MKTFRKLSIIEWILVVAMVCLPLYSYAIELIRQRNVATLISFPIINGTGDEIENATGLLAQISGWNGSDTPSAFVNTTNAPVADGKWNNLNLTAAEMDYQFVRIQVTSNATGAKQQNIPIQTIKGNPSDLATTDDGGAINVTNGKIDEVATLTGHTAQTGDAYEKVNNATFGLSAIKDFVDDLETRLTALRAGYLDKLNVSGTLAHSDDANTYKADVSSLATAAALEVVNATAASINGTAVAVKAQTDKIQFDASNYTKSTPQTGVTVTTNNDKTGYALTQTFPANFSALSINATGLVDILQAAADKAWSSATRSLTDKAGFSISGTKTTLDALNDINATNVWDKDISGYSTAGYAGTYLKGAGSAGDPWTTPLPGSYGAGTAGYIVGNNLNANISSRSSHSATDVAALILATPANKLATNASGYVTTTHTFPGNFSSMLITSAGKVTVGTNDDKTGYTASTVSDKTGYSLSGTQSFNLTGNITGSLSGSIGSLSAAAIQSIWDALTSALTTAGSIGKRIVDYLDAAISSRSTLSTSDVSGAAWNATMSSYNGTGTMGNKLNSIPTSGTGDWSEAEKSVIKDALGIVDNATTSTLQEIGNYTNGEKEAGNYTGIERMIRIQR